MATKTITLTDKELEILRQFLCELSESMGNAGCNDYWLPNTPENREIVIQCELTGCQGDFTREEIEQRMMHSKKLLTMDFLVVDYIARKIFGRTNWEKQDD